MITQYLLIIENKLNTFKFYLRLLSVPSRFFQNDDKRDYWRTPLTPSATFVPLINLEIIMNIFRVAWPTVGGWD